MHEVRTSNERTYFPKNINLIGDIARQSLLGQIALLSSVHPGTFDDTGHFGSKLNRNTVHYDINDCEEEKRERSVEYSVGP